VTDTITAEDIRRLSREVAAEVQAEVYGTGAGPDAGTALPYATPPISGVSDLSLAVDVLMIDENISRAEAAMIVTATADLDPFKDRIAARRQLLQGRADEQARLAWEASPEGRKAAAVTALKAQAERSTLVEGARALLTTQSAEYGITPEMAADLTDDEALRVSGIEPAERDTLDDNANDLAANIAAVNAGEEGGNV
jgi:hypothetical protein